METSLSSSENISCCGRQEPQGEENSSLLQSFGDGNPPPGGGDIWQSNVDLSDIKISSDSPEMHEFDASTSCLIDSVANSYAESKAISQDSLVLPAPNSIVITGSPLSTSNSLISQLLQSSVEHAHLRSLLQNRMVRSCATEPPSETRTQPKHNGHEELTGSRRSPVAPTSEAERVTQEQIIQTVSNSCETSSASYGDSGRVTGSPKSRNGHPPKTASPKSNAGDNGKIGHSVVSGSAGALSRCAAPARDLQRPSTAPSIHQIGPNLEVRLTSNSVLDSSKPAVAKYTPCIGSQPDLTCLVEVTMSNGTVQHVPAKVVTSVRGRELMRLSSYSTIQQPSQYLLPTPKQVQMLPSTVAERQQTKSQNQNSQKKHLPELDHAAIATRATQMVERLSEENQALRQELKSYYKKVSTLEKVERDIQKVSDAYETLVLHSQKRENLEKLMRFKLEAEIRNLNEINKELKEQLERNLYQLQRKQGYSTPDSELKREMQRKDALISKLIVQNRELMNAKERLEMDTSAQRSTMENQLQRIGMLENALTNTQVNANRCDEEIQMERHRTDDQGSSDLQMALSQLQLIAEKQHDSGDQRLGTKIDDDFHLLRNQQCDTDDGISSDSESPTSIHSLIRQMQEKERRILQLEAEVAKWEQKFLDETLFRQLAVDAVSVPKDGRMPGLEPNSLEDGRYWTRTYSDRVMQLRELYEANLRCADSEARLARAIALIRTLHAELAEKEMLIKILQHHASLSRSSSISSLLLPSSSSPLHSPHHRSPTNAAYMMSMSVPASGATSRQSSQVDDDQMYSCTNREQDQRPVHVKSSSANNALGNSYDGSPMLSMELPTQYQASAQALSYGSSQSLQSGSDQLKHCFWQV